MITTMQPPHELEHADPPADRWRPLPVNLADTGETRLAKRQLRNWSLTLEARRLPWRSERYGFGWQLLVPTDIFDRALAELRQYERENHGWPPAPPDDVPLTENRTATLWVLIAIGVFYNLTWQRIDLAGHHPVDWATLGNAHAGRIMAGEWWRSITALTLHANWQHLLGNLLIGGVFITRLCRDLRSGLAWLLLLVAGVFGNLANAWLQSPDHRSVGASTAIFGAVGILAAISMVRYRRSLRLQRRWLLPVAAGLGLLAMLGAGGDNTDLGAHLFGFLFGLPLGLAAELLVERRSRPETGLNLLLGGVAIAVVVTAWWAALAHG